MPAPDIPQPIDTSSAEKTIPASLGELDTGQAEGLQAIEAAENTANLTPETVQRLQRDVVDKLMSNDFGSFEIGADLDMVLANLGQFNVDHQIFALALIRIQAEDKLVEYLENFKGIDYPMIATQIIITGRGYLIAENLDKFMGFNNPRAQAKLAVALIVNGQGMTVAEHLDHFKLNHLAVARILIQMGYGYDVALHFENFKGLDHAKVAQALIVAGEGHSLAQFIDKFSGLNYPELALQIAEHPLMAGSSIEYAKTFAENLSKFPGADCDLIANKFIDAGKGWIVGIFRDKFIGLTAATKARLEHES